MATRQNLIITTFDALEFRVGAFSKIQLGKLTVEVTDSRPECREYKIFFTPDKFIRLKKIRYEVFSYEKDLEVEKVALELYATGNNLSTYLTYTEWMQSKL